MNEEQLLTLWIGAFRYYIGRQTYAVDEFCTLLIQVWGNLPEPVQALIRDELTREFDRDNKMRADFPDRSTYYLLGQKCNRESWERVRQHIAQNKVDSDYLHQLANIVANIK